MQCNCTKLSINAVICWPTGPNSGLALSSVTWIYLADRLASCLPAWLSACRHPCSPILPSAAFCRHFLNAGLLCKIYLSASLSYTWQMHTQCVIVILDARWLARPLQPLFRGVAGYWPSCFAFSLQINVICTPAIDRWLHQNSKPSLQLESGNSSGCLSKRARRLRSNFEVFKIKNKRNLIDFINLSSLSEKLLNIKEIETVVTVFGLSKDKRNLLWTILVSCVGEIFISKLLITFLEFF